MAKVRTTFLCRACGAAHPRWMGKCPDCGQWDSLEKFTPVADEGSSEHLGAAAQWALPEGAAESEAVALESVVPMDSPRISTGIAEFDRVLGGGIVRGSALLLGGDPGIGKSTLLLQSAARIADDGRKVLYVSSEESAQQVKLRAERVFANGGADGGKEASAGALRRSNLFILAETNLSRIASQARRVAPELLVVDSIQMLVKPDVDAAPGSITQLRRACLELAWLAKASGIAVAVVGHVTKDGELAGPRLLEHLVDVVLHFEGDRHHAYRVVRAAKNRFGSTHEIGLFEMTASGLAEVIEGSRALGVGAPRPGMAFVPATAGSRCLIGEIQALTAAGFLGSAKRRAAGLDGNRLAMLIAVLEKHGGLRLADQDVFAQAAGGVRIAEPGADLAIALAVAGAFLGRAVPARFAAIGEIGLTGEVRPVPSLASRIAEVARRGGRLVAVPKDQADEAEASIRALHRRSAGHRSRVADSDADAPPVRSHEKTGRPPDSRVEPEAGTGLDVVAVDSVAAALEVLAPTAASGRAGVRDRTVTSAGT